MHTISFIKSTKNNEKRRALIPGDIVKIKNKSSVYIESSYGDVLGYSDSDYEKAGVNVTTKEVALKQDIICDPKIGDADYLDHLKNQVLFGYVHAVQNKEVTDVIVDNELSAVAWEDMNEDGRHVFWRNNELAGEAAIVHAFSFFGKFPYECKVAIIGRGNTSRGAYRILASLGANIKVYNRKMEELLRKEINEFDVIVNCVLWDTAREDHIIYKNDLKNMKPLSMIIDVSCDKNGAIETCIPTSFENPVYVKEEILHYAVDHTPSIAFRSVSEIFSGEVVKYIDLLIEDKISDNKTLQDALIVENGNIIDKRISEFQKR
ncbi:N(5)-(carboxyethyl)ornithine synthase [Alkalibacterium sp. 20]|uniref:N(5)-(carboxyethyl)ornithine synthase n=1 Tax=Alkalibacterium sp. 20 TaxID=1798803 RepID=UPI0009004A0A|nr:N(5)-(carboxyethyl)ornithine synthase [Alkalibacterium sp. 20]OJF94686.1 N(5)-(carboxyethyl)ornithine synthase [Alkalibacterium sp. 20]